ncbi:MAG: hypothetical protein IJS81_02595 [Selenomonadaceae bacterium]|nr:hypothetical protein [Selenomonadaceae bacterium]MBQ7629088.1 hypothetical protein [Selenomonadaceae bacterium]
MKDKEFVTVPLSKRGENKFIVTAYDDFGREIQLENSEIVIVNTLANFAQILANHSIGLQVLKGQHSSKDEMIYLVRKGDSLPAKGKITLYAGESIRAGDDYSLNFKLWEGEISDPVTDNRFIGHIKIYGTDFEFGKIVEGAEILCSYTVNDAGSVNIDIEIPSIGESFYEKLNFYEAKDGQRDSNETAEKLSRDGKDLMDRIRDTAKAITNGDDYQKLQQAGEIVSTAISANRIEHDKEEILHLEQDLNNVKQILNDIRKNNLDAIQEHELNGEIEFYRESAVKAP